MKNEFTSNKLATKLVIDSAVDSETDWERIDAMQDEDIDFSDCAELTPDLFVNAVVRRGVSKLSSTAQAETVPATTMPIHVDSDIIDWFKTQGLGYQLHINTLLRAYLNAHQAQALA